MALNDTLTRTIATTKRRLLKGGMLQPVEWLRKTGEKDVRGRQAVTTTLIDALIEQRPGLDRDRITTDRADDTVLTILDQIAVIDTDTFRWGDPPDVYKVSKIDGVIKDEETGTRYSLRSHRDPLVRLTSSSGRGRAGPPY